MATLDPTISDAELREHYAQTGVALPFERAIHCEAIRIALAGAAKAARRLAARQARDAATPHQLPPQEAA